MADIHFIDDNEMILMMNEGFAKYHGYSSVVFSSSVRYIEYLTCIDYSPPALVIVTDIDMPGKTGYELISEVQNAYPSQRIVVNSSHPEPNPELERTCFSLGKPTSATQWGEALQMLTKCKSEFQNRCCTKCRRSISET